MTDIVERLRKYIDIQPVAVEGEPDAHNVFLQVTNQRFCITPYCETKDDAKWMADMIIVALGKIISEISQEAEGKS